MHLFLGVLLLYLPLGNIQKYKERPEKPTILGRQLPMWRLFTMDKGSSLGSKLILQMHFRRSKFMTWV
jgi:hypothetical protein